MRSNPFNIIYQSAEYKDAYKLPLRDFPFLLDVEATNKCQLNCVQCTHQIMSREQGFMYPQLFAQIVNEGIKHDLKGIRLILFGEPLLNPNIFKFITFAHRKGLLTHLTTNGLLLTKWNVDALLKSGLDSLIISMQGVDKAGYQEMRGPFYDKVTTNLKYLAALNVEKPYTMITTTILDESPQQVAVFKGYWGAFVDRVDVWETYLEPVKDVERVKPFLSRQRLSPSKTTPCNELYTKMNVLWNGEVTACCDLGNIDNVLPVGVFPQETLYDLWHNHLTYVRMRHPHIPLCQHCHRKF